MAARTKQYDNVLAKRVVNLRDKKKLSWGNIIVEIGPDQVTEGSVRRMYDQINGEGASSKSRPLGNVGRPIGVKDGEGTKSKAKAEPAKKAPAKRTAKKATAAKKPAAKKATPAKTARKVVKRSGIRTSKAS